MTPASALRVYGENFGSLLRSGFAFANAASQPVSVNYDVFASDGSRIARAVAVV